MELIGIFYFLGLMISLALLWVTGDMSVKYSVQTADKFNLNTLFIGFVLIAVSTGLPELSVTITSLFRGAESISAGTILGSNVCDISFVLGLPLLLMGGFNIPIKERKDSLFLLLITSFSMAFVFIMGLLNWVTGFVLILLYVATIWWSWKNSSKQEMEIEEKIQEKIIKNKEPFLKTKWGVFIKLIISILLVLAASELAVHFAMILTEMLSLSHETIGATILAVGTSLPELSLALNAVKKEEYSLAIGNSLGSVLEQGTLLLGLLVVASGKTIDIKPLRSLVPFMFISFAIIGLKLIRRKKISRLDGIIMLGVFLVFLIYQIFWIR